MEETRGRILDAAHRLFVGQGFRGATTRRIAEEAGVNEVTLFRQFSCKEELLAAAIERGSELRTIQLAEGMLPQTPSDVRAELRRFLIAILRGFSEGRQAVRTAMAEWDQHPALQEPLLRTANDTYRQLRTYMKEAQVRGLVRTDLGVTVMTQTIIATVFADGLLRDMTPERFPLRPAASVDAYLDIVLSGLLPPGHKGDAQ